jgi:hypothetical protein
MAEKRLIRGVFPASGAIAAAVPFLQQAFA